MSSAITGSVALTELQKNLTGLSKRLSEIYGLLNSEMMKVGDIWQDSKYQDFMQSYKPQIQKCEAISEQYNLWCTRVLAPTIENVIAVEKTDVSFGGGSVGGTLGGGSSAGTVNSGTATTTGRSKFDIFNK